LAEERQETGEREWREIEENEAAIFNTSRA